MITKPTKYTEAFVLSEVQSMLTEIKNDPSIFFLGQVFYERDYSMQRFSEWKKDFEDNEEISETIKKIKEVLETKVIVGAMKRELHPTLSIFHLKNNYKWTDKPEVSKEDREIRIIWNPDGSSRLPEMTDAELLELIK